MEQKLMNSKAKYGTLTATQDANNDYSDTSSQMTESQYTSGSNQNSGSSMSSVNQSSKAQFDTYTALMDANNDYDKNNSNGNKGGRKNGGSTGGRNS